MTTIEQQIRTYTTTFAGPPRHDGPTSIDADHASSEPSPRSGKVLMRVGAGVLVVIALAAVLVNRSQSESAGPASAINETYPLRVQLEVNTTTPSPTQTVLATLTVTNVSETPLQISRICASDIRLWPTSAIQEPPDPGPDPATAETDPVTSDPSPSSNQIQPTNRTPVPATFDSTFFLQNTASFGPVGSEEPDIDNHACRTTGTAPTLEPGESASVDGQLDVGIIGLAPDDFALVGAPMSYLQHPAVIPFTVPAPPASGITKRDAIKTAWAQPAVRAWAQPLLDAELFNDPNSSVSITRDGDGWRVTMHVAAHSLVVSIGADGTGTVTADGITTPIDPAAAED